jgi:hypothetical protein
MKIDVAHLQHSRRGTELVVMKTPLHALLLDDLGDGVLGAVRHRLCCRVPEWLFRIHWGEPDPDDELEDGRPYYPHSAGRYAYDLGSWIGSGFGTWRKPKEIAKIPVTSEWVREHYPELGWPWDGSEDKEDDD